MTLYQFFKAKQKLRRKDAQGSSSTDVETSEILGPPFPPLLCRAKSPSDILDFVGYPRLPKRLQPSPLPIRQVSSITTTAPLTIRNKTPPIITTTENVAQSLPPPAAAPPPAATAATVQTTTKTTPLLTSPPLPRDSSGFHMPTPKKAMPPTWRILNADQAEKTLIAEDPEKPVKSSDDLIHVNLLQQQVMDFERERQAWARREEEHRQLEQQMLQRIQDNQAKINELSSLPSPQKRQPPVSTANGINRSSFESFVSQQRSTPSYIDDNDNDDDDAYSSMDDYNAYHSYDPDQHNDDADLDQYYHHNCHSHPTDHRLLLFAPMDQHQYQRYTRSSQSTSDDDNDDDDDDSYHNNNSTFTRRSLPYLARSDYGDEEEEEEDEDEEEDMYLNRGPWRHSQPKATMYDDYWSHVPPPPPSRRRRSSIRQQQQQQRGMVYHHPPPLPHSMYYQQQQQRPTSAHVLQEHHRKPLRRHHSFGSGPSRPYYQHHDRRSYRV